MKTEIEKFKPCRQLLEFRQRFDSFSEMWIKCKRGDWMLWIASRLDIDDRLMVLAKAECANTVRNLITDKEALNAIDIAIEYGEEECGRDELLTDVDDELAGSVVSSNPDDAKSAASLVAYHAYWSKRWTAGEKLATIYQRFNMRLTADTCRRLLTDVVFEKLNIKK